MKRIKRIKTGYLMNDKYLKVLIKMPCIEYKIDVSNCSIIKSLGQSEVQEYFNSFFQDWHNVVLSQLESHSLFNELLLEIQCK